METTILIITIKDVYISIKRHNQIVTDDDPLREFD